MYNAQWYAHWIADLLGFHYITYIMTSAKYFINSITKYLFVPSNNLYLCFSISGNERRNKSFLSCRTCSVKTHSLLVLSPKEI